MGSYDQTLGHKSLPFRCNVLSKPTRINRLSVSQPLVAEPEADHVADKAIAALENIAQPGTLGLRQHIEDAGIAIRHSRGYTFSILQGPETDLREWMRCVHSHKNRKPYQNIFFLWKNVLRTSDRMKNTCRICWNR